MAIRLKTKKLIYAGTAGAVLALGISSLGGYAYYTNAQKAELALIEKYEGQISELEYSSVEKEVGYALNEKVRKGELITEAMLTKVGLSEAAAAEDIILLPDLMVNNKYILHAKTDYEPGTVILKSLVYQDENITNDIRETEYSFIELPSKLKMDDYIDVRIQFPTGDEYIVLTKKRVKDLLGITVWMNLGESELLTMSSAIVDAYLVPGTKIYALPYEDPHMQEKAIATYPVKDNVRELLQTSPNVLNVATLELEKRNRARLENNLREMNIEDGATVQSNNERVKGAAETEKARLTEEQRLNDLNNYTQQQEELIGGGSNE